MKTNKNTKMNKPKKKHNKNNPNFTRGKLITGTERGERSKLNISRIGNQCAPGSSSCKPVLIDAGTGTESQTCVVPSGMPLSASERTNLQRKSSKVGIAQTESGKGKGRKQTAVGST